MTESKMIQPPLVDPIEERESEEADRKLLQSESNAAAHRGPRGAPVRRPLFGR